VELDLREGIQQPICDMKRNLLSSSTADSFSREPWVKTNQKNAMQQGEEYDVVHCIPVLLGRFWSGHAEQSRTHECCQEYLTAEWGGSDQTRND
jgi:hypothetical protein